MKKWFLILAALFVLAPVARADDPAFFAHANWEKIRDDDGIQVYRWGPPHSELFAFKGSGVIDAPLPRLATVLLDAERRHEWVPNVIESRLIRVISPLERIEYIALKTPPVTSNRDFVYDGKASWSAERQELTLSFTSVEDPAVPETKMIRGKTQDSTYRLTAIDGGKKTLLECRFLVDPRGNVANWIVNYVQRNLPFNAISGARKQVLRTDVVVSPGVLAILK